MLCTFSNIEKTGPEAGTGLIHSSLICVRKYRLCGLPH